MAVSDGALPPLLLRVCFPGAVIGWALLLLLVCSLGAQWSSYNMSCFANGCRFYPLFVKQCNKMDEVWVPSQFSVDVLRESGDGPHASTQGGLTHLSREDLTPGI